MSTISDIPVAAQGRTALFSVRRLAAIVSHCWLAYINWRIEQAAIAELRSMSDLELKDIGLCRSQIIGAVRGDLECDRTLGRY